MKKTLIIALAMLLAGTTAMAQTKKPQIKKGGTPTITTSAATPQSAERFDGEIFELPPVEMGLDAPLRLAFDKRRSIRTLSEEEIPMEMLSSLLWAAYGFNRPEEQLRVVPSAANVQEFDIYVFTSKGVYLYFAEKNSLIMVAKEDHRSEISTQKHFKVAPVSIVMVANYDRMDIFKDKESRDFYAAVDAGYISQDIYLYCAANGLGTVACGAIDREAIQKILGIKNGSAILAHPVGFAK